MEKLPSSKFTITTPNLGSETGLREVQSTKKARNKSPNITLSFSQSQLQLPLPQIKTTRGIPPQTAFNVQENTTTTQKLHKPHRPVSQQQTVLERGTHWETGTQTPPPHIYRFGMHRSPVYCPPASGLRKIVMGHKTELGVFG